MTGAEQIRLEERQRQEQEILCDVRENFYAMLEDRGLPVPDLIRTRIDACDDITQLIAWFRRAATVDSGAAILEPSG